MTCLLQGLSPGPDGTDRQESTAASLHGAGKSEQLQFYREQHPRQSLPAQEGDKSSLGSTSDYWQTFCVFSVSFLAPLIKMLNFTHCCARWTKVWLPSEIACTAISLQWRHLYDSHCSITFYEYSGVIRDPTCSNTLAAWTDQPSVSFQHFHKFPPTSHLIVPAVPDKDLNLWLKRAASAKQKQSDICDICLEDGEIMPSLAGKCH